MSRATLVSLEEKLEKMKQQSREEESRILARKISLVKRFVIVCEECKKRSTLAQWWFVQDYWYTRPSGCTEGDYWNSSKLEDCHIICPNPQCRNMARIYDHTQKAPLLERIQSVTKDGIALKNIFAEVWEKHGDNPPKRVHPRAR